jgi:hypothetical protein
MDRVYTVEEADALLPELRDRLERIRAARQTMLRHAEAVRDRLGEDGGGAHPGREYVEATQTLRREIERLAEEQIALRDPQVGLVDFPGERDGERVWLCWKLGEERVAYWHRQDRGFAGRQAL